MSKNKPIPARFLVNDASHAVGVAQEYRNRQSMHQNIVWMERQTAFWLLWGSLNTPGNTWDSVHLSIDEDGVSKCWIQLSSEDDELEIGADGDAEADVHNEAFFFIDEIDFDLHKSFLEAFAEPLTRENVGERVKEAFPAPLASHIQAQLMQQQTALSPAQPRPRM